MKTVWKSIRCDPHLTPFCPMSCRESVEAKCVESCHMIIGMKRSCGHTWEDPHAGHAGHAGHASHLFPPSNIPIPSIFKAQGRWPPDFRKVDDGLSSPQACWWPLSWRNSCYGVEAQSFFPHEQRLGDVLAGIVGRGWQTHLRGHENKNLWEPTLGTTGRPGSSKRKSSLFRWIKYHLGCLFQLTLGLGYITTRGNGECHYRSPKKKLINEVCSSQTSVDIILLVKLYYIHIIYIYIHNG